MMIECPLCTIVLKDYATVCHGCNAEREHEVEFIEEIPDEPFKWIRFIILTIVCFLIITIIAVVIDFMWLWILGFFLSPYVANKYSKGKEGRAAYEKISYGPWMK